MLSVRNVEVVYNGVAQVLRGVNLEVQKGQVVTLLGGNRAGKTTLLRAITGLIGVHGGEVTRGEVDLAGQPILGLDPPKIVSAGIAQVMEGRRIFGELSIEENLRAGAFTNRDKAGAQKTMARIYEMFPVLGDRRAQHAGYLSGGEQQMLAIGRAMMANPTLLLLDEPSLGLAPLIDGQIGNIIREVNATGTSVLLIEQNAHMALGVSNFAYILEHGRVVRSGSSEALRADKDIQDFYLGGASEADRSFAEVKSYRRKKKWSA